MRKSFIISIAIGSIILILSRCIQNQGNSKWEDETYNIREGFVGEAACISCHEDQYKLWVGSHHDWAMRIAADSTVLGDFNDQKITLDGVDYHFYKANDEFRVRVKEIDGSVETYLIDHTFGVTPLQQYITAFDNGKRQVLRATWDTDRKQWYHQYADQKLNPNDWLHWTEGGQRWNTMCAECHSTDLKRNYFHEVDSFHTTWSSINVSCEGCHGPGKQHLDWADAYENGKTDTQNYYILNAADQQSQIDQCAPCHSRRVKLTKEFVQGDGFEDQFMLQTVTPEFYHPDGQILEEDYVVGSFLQSKMYMNGIKCNDCHDAHSMQLKKTGNDLCMSCHVPSYNTPEHHFHETGTESAQCINCHMTGAVYMGNDFRRDHSFRNPRPDQSIKYGTPNACTGCHSNKSDQWAADNIVAWYGDKRPEHFSDALLLTTSNEISVEDQDKIRAFILNSKEPYLTRATAIENYSFSYSEKDYKTLMDALKDSSALVRYKALTKFFDLPAEERHALGLKHLEDPSKMVRIGAARLTTDLSTGQLLPEQLEGFNQARQEYETMLYGSADFPLGRLQLGDYYFMKGQDGKAIEQYLIGIEMDSLLTLIYPNLATAYSRRGNTSEAMNVLTRLVLLEPNYGRAYYLRALLHYELKEEESAIMDFSNAIANDPFDFRSYYNLATLHYQRKEYTDAERTIKQGLEIFRDSGEGKYLLALIYNELGRKAEAEKIINELSN